MKERYLDFSKSLGQYARTYRKSKGKLCERCGFIPIHKSQLDVDHKNEDHGDNRKENLWTLCANCHRLKTNRPDLFVIALKIYKQRV